MAAGYQANCCREGTQVRPCRLSLFIPQYPNFLLLAPKLSIFLSSLPLPHQKTDYFLKSKSYIYVFLNDMLTHSSYKVFYYYYYLALEHLIVLIFTGLLNTQHEVGSTVKTPLN